MDIGIIFGQMLVLLTMMLTGAFVYKKKWLGEEGTANISKLVVNVFNPLLVIGGLGALCADMVYYYQLCGYGAYHTQIRHADIG